MNKYSKFVFLLLALLALIFFLADFGGYNPVQLKEEIEVLHKANDSLYDEIEIKDEEIEKIYETDSILTKELEEARQAVKVVKIKVEKEVEVIKTYDSLSVVKFYSNRYPEEHKQRDTLISINKPVLVSAAADLVKYDGAKQIIVLQDSISKVQDSKLALKDSVIGIMYSKEGDYKSIISNKDLEINKWLEQNKALSKENKKLKKKAKLIKILTFGLLGTVSYQFIIK